ncbi:hypothetical protein [Nannocystis bainbridge]|uniref:Uncharacterized protein n=1 Tax=Nannocystis bainbridge TaxID=2995303 RepID=A0ABT5DUY1_9BACT|nr:hypothetical protein [Nannocystis bainbridge]MDC0716221.1 hypothetical protein [Nannocystis bainbridge]
MTLASLTSACPSEGGKPGTSGTDPSTTAETTAETSGLATTGETTATTSAATDTTGAADTVVDTTGEPDTTTMATASGSEGEPEPPPTPCDDFFCDKGQICVIPGPYCNASHTDFVYPNPFCAVIPAKCDEAPSLDLCLEDEYCAVPVDAIFQNNTLECPPEDLDCF